MSRKEDDDFPFFKSYDSFRLGQVINLVYKYNLEFTEELKSLTKKSHPNYLDYYCWLMDIDNFDYSKFNPYWILEFKTIHYLNRFKKSQRLKEELCKALNNNYIEGVAKIYFKNLV